MEDDQLWKMTFDGRQLLMEVTIDVLQPLMESSFDGRHSLMEDNLFMPTSTILASRSDHLIIVGINQ